MTRLRALAGAATLAATLCGILLHPAEAADRDRRPPPHRVYHRPPRQAWGYTAPAYVVAPPPVVYAPPAPPPLVYTQPGISLNFSIP